MIPIELAGACAFALVAAIGVLWRDSLVWRERWAKEVKRKPSDPPPEDENTAVRNRRDLLLKEYLKNGHDS